MGELVNGKFLLHWKPKLMKYACNPFMHMFGAGSLMPRLMQSNSIFHRANFDFTPYITLRPIVLLNWPIRD